MKYIQACLQQGRACIVLSALYRVLAASYSVSRISSVVSVSTGSSGALKNVSSALCVESQITITMPVSSSSTEVKEEVISRQHCKVYNYSVKLLGILLGNV